LETHDLYFEDTGEYSIKRLCSAAVFPTKFLHSAYLEAINPDIDIFRLSWTSWLETVVNIRRIQRLEHPSNGETISKFGSHICDKLPDQLVGLLREYWSQYQHLHTNLLEVLGKTIVLTRDGSLPLRETILPTPQLLQICRDLDVEKGMAFLRLPCELIESNQQEWTFLESLDVRHEANLGFYLEALICFANHHSIF